MRQTARKAAYSLFRGWEGCAWLGPTGLMKSRLPAGLYMTTPAVIGSGISRLDWSLWARSSIKTGATMFKYGMVRDIQDPRASGADRSKTLPQHWDSHRGSGTDVNLIKIVYVADYIGAQPGLSRGRSARHCASLLGSCRGLWDGSHSRTPSPPRGLLIYPNPKPTMPCGIWKRSSEENSFNHYWCSNILGKQVLRQENSREDCLFARSG